MSCLPNACPHRPPCPGCPRYGDTELHPGSLNQLVALCAEVGAPRPRVETAPAAGYRHRVRLAVRGRVASAKVGIFRQGTHEVVDIPNCPIHHPLVNRVVATFKRCLAATRTPTYAEHAHASLVRYLQVVVERPTQRAQVVVVANAERAEAIGPLLEALAQRLGDTLHSLHFNGNTERTNTILGPVWQLVSGPAAVQETIGGARVFYPPDAFGQSNLGLADRAVEAIHELVTGGERLIEFYAGVGAIGLGLVGRFPEVVFNELGPGSVRGLRLGIEALSPELAARVAVVEGPAGSAAKAVRPGDTVVVDPPRKGLDAELLSRLNAVGAACVVYLSCDLPSLVRDARSLIEAGGYRLRGCCAFGFVPFTHHVETLAWFESGVAGARAGRSR